MATSKAQRAETAERRAALIRLRRAGVPFDDPRILGLGYSSTGHASKDLIRALTERRDEWAAEASVYRQEENERLDSLLAAAWPHATEPRPIYDKEGNPVGEGIDLKAVDTVLKLMDRRAKLNGLDSPVRTEVSGPDGGAVPLGAGSLADLNKLIAIAGQTGSAGQEPDTTTDEDEEGDGSSGDDRDR